jgi:hypothetical protein
MDGNTPVTLAAADQPNQHMTGARDQTGGDRS